MATPAQPAAENDLSAHRERIKHTFKPLDLAVRSEASGSWKSEIATSAELTFGEDYALEHRLFNLQNLLIRMSGGKGDACEDAQESPESHGFPG